MGTLPYINTLWLGYMVIVTILAIPAPSPKVATEFFAACDFQIALVAVQNCQHILDGAT